MDSLDAGAGPDSILDFLNAGGAVPDLSRRLNAIGLASGAQDSTRVLDLNDDGRLDVALALADPPSSDGSTVLLLLCEQDQYVLAQPLVQADVDAVPILHAGLDLTGDDCSDVLVGWRTCGAHTCQQRLEVLSVAGTRVVRWALDPSVDLSFPEVAILTDGSVVVTATGVGSVGAGPFRRFTRAWTWDPASQTFLAGGDVFEPARYRIHVLLDADAAARIGERHMALDLYHRVILDDLLLDWVDPETERANLTGYAMFRVVGTYLQMNDEGDAQKAYGILQNQYPAGSVGQAYAAMAQAYWDAYTADGDLEQACIAAQAYAESQADAILMPLYFGYANPTYTAADVCPGEGQ